MVCSLLFTCSHRYAWSFSTDFLTCNENFALIAKYNTCVHVRVCVFQCFPVLISITVNVDV